MIPQGNYVLTKHNSKSFLSSQDIGTSFLEAHISEADTSTKFFMQNLSMTLGTVSFLEACQ